MLSGADIEGMVGRAWRKSLLTGHQSITAESLTDVVEQFLPSTQGLEKELQELAAIIECTDREFLPRPIVERMEKGGGPRGVAGASHCREAARRGTLEFCTSDRHTNWRTRCSSNGSAQPQSHYSASR
jgi:hypothetical protein